MVVAASRKSESHNSGEVGHGDLRQQLHDYTQTFAFRQFFSNFLALSQREPLRALTIFSCFLEPSPGVFSAAFAYHAARVLVERVLLVEVGLLPADDSAYIRSVVGEHQSLRRKREGLIDVLRIGNPSEEGEPRGVEAADLGEIKANHDLTIFAPSSLGLTEPSWNDIREYSDTSFILCSPAQLRKRMVQRRIGELQERGLKVGGCVVIESAVAEQ